MKFSILCLTYKRKKLLERCIYSVLSQRYDNWEMIIVNDNPEQHFVYDKDNRIKIYNLKFRFPDIAQKRNFSKSLATGDWLFNLDDDDFILPNYLYDVYDFLRSSKCDWLCCQRSIMYYDNLQKAYLSPVPRTNNFFFNKKISENLDYVIKNGNELDNFYERTMSYKNEKMVFFIFKTDKCGHVWDVTPENLYRKYSLLNVFNSKDSNVLPDETSITDEPGTVPLYPHFDKDYYSIIRKNLKVIPFRFFIENVKNQNIGLKNIKELYDIIEKIEKDKNVNFINDVKQSYASGSYASGSSESVQNKNSNSDRVKFILSWDSATKFIESAYSRGIIHTLMDKNSGNRVSDEILRRRKLSCFGSVEKRISPCENLRFVQGHGYFCNACGCGVHKRARLDGDSETSYTKLHYPYLECPLEKRGFSNENLKEYVKILKNPPLSIIIPVINDNRELNLTIESIRDTSPSNVEIIVIDDVSDIPVKVNDESVIVRRNNNRMGVGGCRHLGAEMARGDFLLFIDSHMRFTKNWYNNIMKRLISSPENVVWCGSCLGLSPENMDIYLYNGKYYGARLVLYYKPENQVFEGKWIPKPDDADNDPEITCLMGACYFFHKSWFFKIGGTKFLRIWGSDEPFLSAKTLLAGGVIKFANDVEIGHQFRNKTPYYIDTTYVLYNKIRCMRVLFSDKLCNYLESKISNSVEKDKVLMMIKNEQDKILQEREYYSSVFIHDENWLIKKLGEKINI